MSTTRAGIENMLGPADTRYFGRGFQRVTHQITNVVIESNWFTGTMSATARIDYPPNWSAKNSTGHPMVPHLSTIDALVIAAQLAEAYLTHAHGLDPAARTRMWIPEFEMTAGHTAQTHLTAIPIHGQRVGLRIGPWGSNTVISIFEFRIGTLRLSCRVQHDLGAPDITTASCTDLDHLLGSADRRHYGRGHTHRHHHIHDVTVDTTRQQAQAQVHVNDTSNLGWQGLAASYEPSLSLIDATICTAQLAQVLAYTLDEVDRADTGTFWMRRFSMRSTTPVLPITDPIPLSTRVLRHQQLDHAGNSWRTYRMTGDIAGIKATGSLAFTTPGATPTTNHSGNRP